MSIQPSLMIQGVSSNAGKSILTTALCRILHQDGVRVAPFKSQNMSLNSFVTMDNLEIARSQVTQAQACHLEPDVRMNPILLKPNSDTGCQVIVEGKAIKNMNVKEYHDYKSEAFHIVQKNYDSLSRDFDLIILEGAGSPAEINLKQHDIVNMQMAKYANAKVLLVGDIDRGGIFASFVGTLELLETWERDLVKGFIINRFRGDSSLLQSAYDYMLERTQKPVIGTIPYIESINLPDEDSVSFKATPHDQSIGNHKELKIAIIDLPHISNLTDFDSLKQEPDVEVQIIRNPEEIKKPDLLLIPGSKNTITDLKYLIDKNFNSYLYQLAEERQTTIIGICAGFQMLGRTIVDELHIESQNHSIEGLNLLNMSTAIAPYKTLKQVSLQHSKSGLPIYGYEIHHGQSNFGKGETLMEHQGRTLAYGNTKGNIWGSYLHGLFDSDPFRHDLLNRLRIKKGLKPFNNRPSYDLNSALDHLAETVRSNMDINLIYDWLKL